jgi:hypothetical protein
MPTGYPDYYMNTWNPLDAGVCTFKEDFLAGLQVDGSCGEYGWRINGIGDGAYVAAHVPDWPNLGVVRIGGQTGADNGVAIFLHREVMFGALGSHAPWDSLFVFRLVGDLTKTRARVGWTSGGLVFFQPTNGIWLRYDQAVGFADPHLMLCARHSSADSEMSYDTGVAADTNFHTLRIRSLEAGVALMTLDYGAEISFGPAGCDVTVTLPSGGLEPTFSCGTTDGTLVTMDCDYAAFQSWGMAR